MQHKIIESLSIFSQSRWDVGYFLNEKLNGTSRFPLAKLGSVLKERKAGIEPTKYPDHVFNYVGLENISSNTRVLVGFQPKLGVEIRSRSKIYREGDILYGRMRPTLNKVLKIDGRLKEGVCSNEIFVLTANNKLVKSSYIEELLSSDWVQREVIRLVGGATMPRINIKDFLSIDIPLPPLSEQEVIGEYLLKRREDWIKKLHMVESEREVVNRLFNEFIETGVYESIDDDFFEPDIWDNPLPDLEF